MAEPEEEAAEEVEGEIEAEGPMADEGAVRKALATDGPDPPGGAGEEDR